MQAQKNMNISGTPWAILPEKLNEINAAYKDYIGGKHNLAVGSQEKSPGAYEITPNGVAVISIFGVITKNPSFWGFLFGGTSSVEAGIQLKDALDNPSVEGTLLNIDSPGGTVDGTQELAELVFSSRGRKPIVAFTDGMMASAAYWIGSAADRMYISGDTISIGSIGVVATHRDYSEWEKKVGVKTTEVYAGKYKRIASQHRPLSQEGKESIQDQVDYLYAIFVDEVAKHRSVSPEKVLKNMADGKIFIGKQAITAGLVDGVSTFDQLINTALPKAVLRLQTERAGELSELNSLLGKERNKMSQKETDKALAGLSAVKDIKEWKSNPELRKRFNNDFGRYVNSIEEENLRKLNDSFKRHKH